MNVEIFTLADHAEDYGGKLCILGTFDSIVTHALPSVHPHCSIALRLRFQKSEEGNHAVRIVMIDADGRNYGPQLDGNLAVAVADGNETATSNLVLGLNGFPLTKAGTYHLDLVLDGQLVARLPLTVNMQGPKSLAA